MNISMYRLLFILPVVLVASCGNEPEKTKKEQYTTQQVKDLSVQMNVWDEKKENDEINQYLKQHNWEMQETASGLRYMLLKKGNGPLAQNGQKAKVAYKIYLLDGSLIYSADRDSAKEFLIGKDYVESGLHEGIQLMHVGDKMRFVLPSHLAHGLTGDQSKIPPLSSVMYEIELVGVSDDKE
ncbi:MAG TPA: FKBP-type peptidyl-prolyl cis-trans isomerase [Bacteroidia bacterium]|nr:FKBP-type peptidyl-prolyl cis-trans isomerase [Bacteroidia bacterium]